MRGYTTKALIIFPKPETISAQHVSYKERLKKTVNNLQDYLQDQGIKVYSLITDETATQWKLPGIEFISNATKVDRMFIRNNCIGMDGLEEGEDFYEPEINKVADSIPMPRGLDVEERFKIVQKREAKVNKHILTDMQVIIDLSVNRARTFKIPPSKENDSRILVTVNKVSNQLEIMLGGRVMNPNDILGFTGASRPIHMWEKGDWNER